MKSYDNYIDLIRKTDKVNYIQSKSKHEW